MNIYPQLNSGSVTQFPVTRTRSWRIIRNILESNERVVLPDSLAGRIAWNLRYEELTDAEAENIRALFQTAQGSYAPFTFIDPMANLLGWSEDLSQNCWQLGLLQRRNGATDPLGTQRATTISNGSAGSQALTQSLGVPGSYMTCFSVWLRSNSPGTVLVQRDGIEVNAAVGIQWNRTFVSGRGTAGAASSTFGLGLAAGQTIDVWGLQVETQPNPGIYKPTGQPAGIYEETYFAGDELSITSTAAGLSCCAVQLVSRIQGS